MTKNEAEIALKYQLICVCGDKKAKELGITEKSRGPISQIIKYYNKTDKRFSYSVTVDPTEYPQDRYTVSIEDVNISAMSSAFVEGEIKKTKKRLLKELITNLMENMTGKRAIYAFIGKLIDEINEEKERGQNKNE